VGSVNLAAAVGLAAGLSWALEQRAAMLRAIGFAETLAREIARHPGLSLAGSAASPRIPAVSFRPLDVTLESAERSFAGRGLFVRAGQHCAPLALDAVGAPEGTLRVSFGPTNREEDLVACLAAVDALR
jgi:selenocysteine lyase/cysteine desulfurase